MNNFLIKKGTLMSNPSNISTNRDRVQTLRGDSEIMMIH